MSVYGEPDESLTHGQAQAWALEALALLGTQWQRMSPYFVHASSSRPSSLGDGSEGAVEQAAKGAPPGRVSRVAQVAGAQMLVWLLHQSMEGKSLSLISFRVSNNRSTTVITAGSNSHNCGKSSTNSHRNNSRNSDIRCSRRGGGGGGGGGGMISSSISSSSIISSSSSTTAEVCTESCCRTFSQSL